MRPWSPDEASASQAFGAAESQPHEADAPSNQLSHDDGGTSADPAARASSKLLSYTSQEGARGRSSGATRKRQARRPHSKASHSSSSKASDRISSIIGREFVLEVGDAQSSRSHSPAPDALPQTQNITAKRTTDLESPKRSFSAQARRGGKQ